MKKLKKACMILLAMACASITFYLWRYLIDYWHLTCDINYLWFADQKGGSWRYLLMSIPSILAITTTIIINILGTGKTIFGIIIGLTIGFSAGIINSGPDEFFILHVIVALVVMLIIDEFLKGKIEFRILLMCVVFGFLLGLVFLSENSLTGLEKWVKDCSIIIVAIVMELGTQCRTRCQKKV